MRRMQSILLALAVCSAMAAALANANHDNRVSETGDDNENGDDGNGDKCSDDNDNQGDNYGDDNGKKGHERAGAAAGKGRGRGQKRGAAGARARLDDDARGDWPMYNHDPLGTRANPVEQALSPATVARLGKRWELATPAPVSSTPAVVGERVFAADFAGHLYALDAATGRLIWRATVDGAFSASPLVSRGVVMLGDLGGLLYGFDSDDGRLVWKVRPNPHAQAAFYGSGTAVGRLVAFGVSSHEEQAAADPSYPCCSFRGSVVLLDPCSGRVRWQTFLVSDAERAAGAAGAAVWSTPTYDAALGLVYVTTGNNYSQPTTGTEDALIALDARSGAVRWVNQRVADDSWNYSFPFNDADHPDSDFADSPAVYRLGDGRRVVGAGEKNGFYFVVDAVSGALVRQNQVQPAGPLGGLFADSAFAGGVAFANGSRWRDPAQPPEAGLVTALSGDAARVLWQRSFAGTSAISGVAVANGVVYFTTLVDGTLHALAAADGRSLAAVALGRGSASGPAVAHGRVFVGAGNPIAGDHGGSIIGLGL